jgi:hypothetical protein
MAIIVLRGGVYTVWQFKLVNNGKPYPLSPCIQEREIMLCGGIVQEY